MKYRLIYANTGEPCSDWTEDENKYRQYLAERPDWVQKIVLQSSPDTNVNLCLAEVEIIKWCLKLWRAQHPEERRDDDNEGEINCLLQKFIGVVGELNDARVAAEQDDFRDYLRDDARTNGGTLVQYRIVNHCGEQIVDWYWELAPTLRFRDELDRLLPQDALYVIDSDMNEVTADISCPVDEEFRQRILSADAAREQKFEDAAETADQMSKLNYNLPNDEPEVWYIDKHQ